jgi:DNA-binding NtrC family response regulator
MLLAHSWPGNVRELENVLEMAAIICDARVITPVDLSIRACAVGDGPSAGRGLRAPTRGSGDVAPGILPMRDFEAKVIRQAVEEYGGNVSEAARKLGVSRSTVYRKMREYGLNREVHIS